MPPRGESERRKEIRRGEFDPQTGLTTTGGAIGRTNRRRQEPDPFALPEDLLGMLTQGGQYEIPWEQQMLLQQEAFAGGVGPEQMQATADRFFTPQRWAQLQGIDLSEETYAAQGNRLRMPGGQGYQRVPAHMTPEEFISSLTPYQQWREQQIQGLTTGAEQAGGAFLPEKEPYMAELQGTLDEFAAQLGIRKEAFETDVAGRGIGPGGAGVSPYYQDVVAPVMRAGGQATRQAYLDYLNAYQRGSMFQEDVRQSAISRLTSSGMQAEQIRGSNVATYLQATLGEGGLELGYEELYQKSRIAGREFAFRAYENKLRWAMFQAEMAQRERESKRSFWSKIFGGAAEAGTTYLLGGGGGT